MIIYLQTIYELLRYISHVPTLIPHATMKDTTLGGYTLPKGTQVYFHFKLYVSLEITNRVTVSPTQVLSIPFLLLKVNHAIRADKAKRNNQKYPGFQTQR